MRIFLIISTLLVLEIYAFQAIRALTRNRWIYGLYFAVSLFILLHFFVRVIAGDRSAVLQGSGAYALGYVLALVLAQIVLTAFLFAEDIIRFFTALFFRSRKTDSGFQLPSRRRFLSTIALGIAAVPFTSLIMGMYRGKYNYKVFEYELEFEDLPDSFDGYRIVQISDLHCGSFDNKEKVKYGIDLIKEQQADALFFTGDLVNNTAEEMQEWKDLLRTVRARDGVYSVLGNHDYGDYYRWKSPDDKKTNFARLKQVHQEMGWDLLLNENRTLTKNGENLYIVGVENWGNGRFPKYGDIDKAAEDLRASDFKILLSHDPSHWEEIVQTHQKNFQLTLSGHTHGMQFGIEIPGVIRWSPAKYRYKYWAGIYKEYNRYINVNRGFGYLAYPGRVGIWPEITLITLKKKSVV